MARGSKRKNGNVKDISRNRILNDKSRKFTNLELAKVTAVNITIQISAKILIRKSRCVL